MRVSEIFSGDRPVFSFEFFPPKTDRGAANLMNTVADLKTAHAPDFVSVTSGAGGSTRDRTIELVSRIERELGITTMAHQTCIASTRQEIESNLATLQEAGVQNVLALRGDKPKGESDAAKKCSEFEHATELIQFLAESPYNVDIGAACYPERHPESDSSESDLNWTSEKARLGANFLISQLFFDNSHYYEFCQPCTRPRSHCSHRSWDHAHHQSRADRTLYSDVWSDSSGAATGATPARSRRLGSRYGNRHRACDHSEPRSAGEGCARDSLLHAQQKSCDALRVGSHPLLKHRKRSVLANRDPLGHLASNIGEDS